MRIARFICSLLLGLGLFAMPSPSQAQVAVALSVRIGPPVLPIYVQPYCPGPGYIWVPGYWAYGPDEYFWVPGTWVYPPEAGLLWTPGYWAWENDFYFWHGGYWGPVVGYYGGINYGFGYTGVGFFGGYWRGRTYFYNRAVTNVNVTVVRNTYHTTVINNTTINRVSFNGGAGGTRARPTAREMDAARKRRSEMTSVQLQHQQAAGKEQTMRASVNRGRPEVAATPRPSEFHGHGAGASDKPTNSNRVPEKSREINRPGNSPGSAGGSHPDRPSSSRPSNAAPVDPRLEQKHQRDLDKMRQQQDADRQKLERQHNQDRQKLDQNRANQQRQDQLQRRQQQQQEQMNRSHDQQTQRLEQRQQKETQKQDNKRGKNEVPPRR
jgi:WXXGXW repeat (2 copies)